MSVYVDDNKAPYKGMIMSHMMADTLDELHAMADKIGIKRKWFQNGSRFPHYDICQVKKTEAIKNGAIQLTSREMVIKITNK